MQHYATMELGQVFRLEQAPQDFGTGRWKWLRVCSRGLYTHVQWTMQVGSPVCAMLFNSKVLPYDPRTLTCCGNKSSIARIRNSSSNFRLALLV